MAPSWQNRRYSDEIVRRSDFEPFSVKDYLTHTSGGRQAMLKPAGFHRLLIQRVDSAADAVR